MGIQSGAVKGPQQIVNTERLLRFEDFRPDDRIMATLTEDIDDDLYERLGRLRQERGISLDQIANEVIRIRLDHIESVI